MTYERKVTVEQELEIVKKYEVGLISCIALAAEYGMTRQGIHKILRKNGVDTRRMGANCRPTVKCHHCGVMFQVNRARVRGNDGNFYHSRECWLDYLQSIKIGKLSRSGLYKAREVILAAGAFVLFEGAVVHHVDGDDNNNALSNLEIYATQGDHVRMHRGFDVAPIWRGIDFIKEAGNEHLS